MSDGGKTWVAVIILALLVCMSVMGFVYRQEAKIPQVAAFNDTSMTAVTFAGTILGPGEPYSSDISVAIIFNESDQNRLTALLNNLYNPLSSQYGKFLTEEEFIANFSPSPQFYQSAINYFENFGIHNFTTFQNRLVLGIYGNANQIGDAFNTSITGSPSIFGPSATPELPHWLAIGTSNVIGLSSAEANLASLYYTSIGTSAAANLDNSNYPTPIIRSGVEYIYGSDLQVSYNETKLFGPNYDKGAVIATILWSGYYNNSAGAKVSAAPYNPSVVSDYFNTTFPSGVPHPSIYPVPVNNAPLPGPSANKDTTGASLENTLDIEMAGSLAPGASIYNVYAPNNSLSNLTFAFNTALSPPPSASALQNVSVISNSWGTSDLISSSWNSLLMEASARGITVLASTGDSGDNQNSSKYIPGNPTYVQFPSTIGYGTFGVVAVGGTSITINPNSLSQNYLSIQNNSAWYIPESDTSLGGPIGTTGGISSVYPEPSWQKNNIANTVINGAGRGVPDIGAIANNTIILFQNATSGEQQYSVGGTSVSSPVEAGIIATIDLYLQRNDQPSLGFADPKIYALGNYEYNSTVKKPLGFLEPFYPVPYGRNHVYTAHYGYDLLTGMGSIDAYDFAVDSITKLYAVNFTESGLPSGSKWNVSVGYVSNTSSNSSITFHLANGTYEFYISDSGRFAPSPQYGSFTVSGKNLSIQVTFKYGYVAQFNETGLPAGMAWSLVTNNGSYKGQASTDKLIMILPNGTYNYHPIAGDPNYVGENGSVTVNGSQIYHNVTFKLGRFNVTFVETGLPQGYVWNVTASNSTASVTVSSNNTTLNFYLYGGTYQFQVNYSKNYVPNQTFIILNTNGMDQVVNIGFLYGYEVIFVGSGLDNGVNWSVDIGNIEYYGNTTNLSLFEPNGTYYYSVNSPSNYTVVKKDGNFTVNGSNVTVVIEFVKQRGFIGKIDLAIVLIALGVVIAIGIAISYRKR
ncbi:MAG: protease pro-enzyme activation domain-containing protein [Thermoplasmataceae archaeon]